MVVLPEEIIFSDEEEFFKKEDGEHDDEEHVPEVQIEERVVAVTPLDDVEIEIVGSTRPMRSNSGIGVERIQMSFSGKDYGAK